MHPWAFPTYHDEEDYIEGYFEYWWYRAVSPHVSVSVRRVYLARTTSTDEKEARAALASYFKPYCAYTYYGNNSILSPRFIASGGNIEDVIISTLCNKEMIIKGRCRKCKRDGIMIRTALMCPVCNELLGGF